MFRFLSAGFRTLKPGLLLFLLACICSGSAFAQMVPVPGATETQTGITLPEPLTAQAVRELVSRLSDAEVRQLLLQRLDAVASQQAEAGAQRESMIDFLAGSTVSIFGTIVDAVGKIPELGSRLAQGWKNFVVMNGWLGVIRMVSSIAGAIIAGIGAEVLVNYLTMKWRLLAGNENERDSLSGTLFLLSRRLFFDMVGVIAFIAVAGNVAYFFIQPETRPIAHAIMIYLVAVPKLLASVSRFLLAPYRRDLRLVSIESREALLLQRNLIGLSLLIGASMFIVTFMAANSVSMRETHLGFWLNNAIFLWLAFMAFRFRRGLTQMARGWAEDVTPMEARLAKSYPWFALSTIILGWIMIEIVVARGHADALEGGRQYITLGLVLLAPVMDTAIRGLVRHLVPPMKGEGRIAERAWRSTNRSYIRIGRVIVFGLIILTIAGIWNIEFANLASAGIGVRFAAKLITLMMILAAGYLVWEVATLLINRKLANEMTASGADLDNEESGGEGGGAGGSRLSTILPLTRLAVQSTVVIMTVLIALSNLGIDITPLLAGAGIIGLAIGFGAQALVRDVVSGLFFLIDDAFRIGEYLVIDNTVGTVEKISVRSLQLRHHEGPVHTIPYGEIPRVTNNSRDWVIVKMRFTVPFETDINKIKRIFKQIGKDVMEQPYAGDIIQTFKSQGVNGVDDVGIVVRGKFMCKPGKQWVIRKDIYSRVQRAFSENGIEFARREVRVNIADPRELDEDARKTVAAAANDAIEAAAANQT